MADGKQRVLSRLANSLGGVSARRRAMVNFAHKHELIYFASVSSENESTPVIRGSTVAPGYIDSNYCIGTHAGYDMAIVERLADVAFDGYKTTMHRWYVLEIDLKNVSNLPFIFIGTKQQTKAYYAKLLMTHRNLRYLALDSAAYGGAAFHSHYAVLGTPSDVPLIYRLLTDEIIDTLATHKYPFAVEIEGDSLYIFTESTKQNQQLLDKLLHFGLWMAGEIDSRLN
jgi:hypothetical protein